MSKVMISSSYPQKGFGFFNRHPFNFALREAGLMKAPQVLLHAEDGMNIAGLAKVGPQNRRLHAEGPDIFCEHLGDQLPPFIANGDAASVLGPRPGIVGLELQTRGSGTSPMGPVKGDAVVERYIRSLKRLIN